MFFWFYYFIMFVVGGIGFDIVLLLGLWFIWLVVVWVMGILLGVLGVDVGEVVFDFMNDIGVL